MKHDLMAAVTGGYNFWLGKPADLRVLAQFYFSLHVVQINILLSRKENKYTINNKLKTEENLIINKTSISHKVTV